MRKPATIDPRLQRLLGGDTLAALRARLRRHYERGGAAGGVLHLGDLHGAEREALALLSGRPASSARSLRLDLAQLDLALRNAGIATSLHDALQQLDGPLTDRSAERAAAQTAWQALLAQPRADARLRDWLVTTSAAGLLKRLAHQDCAAASALLAQADAVLQRLPAPGLPRAQLAAQTLGDAHALDDGRPVATLVLAAWRHAPAPLAASRSSDAGDPGTETDSPAQEEATDPAAPAPERSRDLWARAGVLVNELARPVLVLNLPSPTGSGALTWQPGEPAYLSLRWLLRHAPAWAVAGRTVYVCENPNLLAIAADRLGPQCAPLVCTDGMPAAAQRTLLQQLSQCGARLRCHADFDWPGLRIINQLLSHPGTEPWCMGTADYEAAALTTSGSNLAMTGPEATALWDARLAHAMHKRGRAIAEEALADRLLNHLSQTR
jgi:uncharacterized protein (TIGR02679 family)